MQRRILIIDDNDDLATALEEVLTGVGHSVALLDNRPDALEATDVEQFDLVITDLDIQSFAAAKSQNGSNPAPEIDPQHIKAFKVLGL